MEFSFSYPADPGMRFAPDAFLASVGSTVPLKHGEWETEFTVLKVEIEPDGSKATLIGEIDDSAAEAVLSGAVIW